MKEKPNHEALNKKLENLPLPDEELSWQKMKALLDKDEKKDPVLLPFFLNCGGWALLILLTAGGIWFFRPFSNDDSVSKIDPVETMKKNETGETKKTEAVETEKLQTGDTSPTLDGKSSSDSATSYNNKRNDPVVSVPVENKNDQQPENTKDKNRITKLNDKEENKRTASNSPVVSRTNKAAEKTSQPPGNSPANKALTQTNQDTDSESKIAAKEDALDNPVNEALTKSFSDSSAENNIAIKRETDSATSETTDGDSLLTKNDSVSTKQKNRNLYFAAGLSLQQQVPLNNQSLNAYTINGRKNSLPDYLPAIYLRLYKNNKWFVQAGFRYSAPQATKEFAYRSRTTRDAVRRTTTTATLALKKTFYHQVPFSFNYSLLPNFSLGAGGMYSRFETAISELEMRVRNNQTNAERVTREITKVPSKTDPFFAASQWHYLLQGEYSWKKWGLGLRYTGALQPFTEYVENGITKEEKNNSLQFFLRYDFVKKQLK